MRLPWLVLFLVVLNVIYYGWHRHQGPQPPEATESVGQAGRLPGITLLREAKSRPRRPADEKKRRQCLFLGGMPQAVIEQVRQRLLAVGVYARWQKAPATAQQGTPSDGQPSPDSHWLQIDDAQGISFWEDPRLRDLGRDFPGLLHRVDSCRDVASH